METRISSDSLIPIILSLVITIFWLLNRSILIAYGKDFIKEGIKWIGNKPILVPTFAVFIFPIFTAYLTINQIPDILKFILPVITFIAGQFIGRYEKQNESKNKQKEILAELKRSFSITREKISSSKAILQLELKSINDRTFVETRLQFIDKITEYFLRLDPLLTLTNDNLLSVDDLDSIRKLSSLIDEFNELIKERREYRLKCRELTSNSSELYYDLLKYTDEYLLKKVESLEHLVDKISKVEIKV